MQFNHSFSLRVDFQFRPSLDDATPIANWLTEAAVKSDDAKATAERIFTMVNELAKTGGLLVDGSSGRAKVKPSSMLLGELQTWSQPTIGVSIRVEPQDWALLTWIWSTIALAALDAILIVCRGIAHSTKRP